MGELQDGAEGVYVVIVDLGDMWVRNDNEREVSEGEDTFGEADGEDGTGVAGRGEEALRGERRIAISKWGEVSNEERNNLGDEMRWVAGDGAYRTRSCNVNMGNGISANRATSSLLPSAFAL